MELSIITALQRVRRDIINGTISTNTELASRMAAAMTIKAGDLRLPRYAESEPPSSVKFNAISDQITRAFNDRKYVFDLLMAASVYDYDVAMRALDDLEDRVLGLVDTVKTLYFFSRPAKAGVHIVSSDFTLGNGVFSGSSSLSRQTGAGYTLPIVSKIAEPTEPVCTGTGIAGNWFVQDGGLLRSRVSDASLPSYLGDTNPSTWFEWESFRISPATYELTKGYGFGFLDSTFKWAEVDRNDITMTAEINYTIPIQTNYIVVTPAIDCPEFSIERVSLFLNGKNVREALPQRLIVNPELMMHGENGYTNEGNLIFPATMCDKIVIDFSSTVATPCQIRHAAKYDAAGNRVPGDSPTVIEPDRFVNNDYAVNYDTKIEVLPADRFCISLKDISVQSLVFSSEGYAQTEVVTFDKVIDRVAVLLDADVPEDTYAHFQISFNDGESWYYIKPIGTAIDSQVIAVNDLIPAAYQDPSTLYIVENFNPRSFRASMFLGREVGENNTTPVVRSVEFEVTLKP